MKPRSIKTYLAILALSTLVLGGVCALLASRPDQELSFTREVPTTLSRDTLNLSIQALANWPKWFYSVAQADRVDAMGRVAPGSTQTVEKGELIRLDIHPHAGQNRGSFELLLMVRDFEPKKRIELEIIGDRSQRILRLFEHVTWTIEIVDAPAGSPTPLLIRAIEHATTRHWRARLFSVLSERILLNQIFYPNVMALGEFTQPAPLTQYPTYGQ